WGGPSSASPGTTSSAARTRSPARSPPPSRTPPPPDPTTSVCTFEPQRLRSAHRRCSGGRGEDLEGEVLELGGVDRGGGLGHRVDAGLWRREGDDLADVLLAGQDGHQAVDAEGEAAVGRGAVAERRQEEAEAPLRLLLVDAEQVEDPLLQVGLVDPDRAGAELPAVEDEVIGPGPHVHRVRLELVEVV